MSPDDLGSFEALQALNPKDCTEQVRALYVAVAIRLGDGTPEDRALVLTETRRWFQHLDWSGPLLTYMSCYDECSRDDNTTWAHYTQLHPLDHDRLLLMKHLNEECSNTTYTIRLALAKMRRPPTNPFPLDAFIEQWDAKNQTLHLSALKKVLVGLCALDKMTQTEDKDMRLAYANDVFHLFNHAMTSWKEPLATMALPDHFADATP